MDSQRTPGRTLLGRLPRTTSRHFTKGTLFKAAAAAIVGAVIAASAVVPAQAATGDVSEAEGVLLSGSGIVNLDTIAQLKGAYSSTNATTSAGTVANPLDLTAVNALGVNLGNGVQLLGANGILQLGVAGQYANTTATTSTAAAGLVGSDGTIAVGAGTPGSTSSLNLTPLLSRVGAASAVASSAELDLGALASRIQEQRTTGAATTGYGIASAKFQLTSPAVAGLNTSLQTTVNGIGSSLNNAVADPAALNSVVSGTTGGLTSALNTLGLGVLSLNGTALTANITGLNLAAVTAPVLAQTYTSGPVTINPTTGRIVIDLNTLQALNGQDPNTKLLSTQALQSIVTAAIQDILVTQIPAALNTAVVTAIGNATLNATLTAKISLLGANVANLNVNMTTSLANLLKTTGRAPLTVTASATAIGALGLTISSAVLNPLLQPLVDGTVAPLLRGLVAPTVGTITSTLAATTGLVNTVLAPLTGILNQLVTITVNAQDSTTGFRDPRGDDAGSQSVSALRLTVLPALNAATVNLATSTVNATPIASVAITAPTVGQQFTVATTTATRSITVTGTGEPGADVAIDLGNGRRGTATVAADGTWSSTIPGVGVGSVTASVTQTFGGVAGSPVTRAFTVVAQAPLTITSPTAGRTFTVVSNSATTPVTITGTSTPGAAIALDLGSGITGTATAQADGTWSATIPSLAVGPYTASVTQSIGGTTSAAVTRSFSVAAGAPLTVATPTEGTRIVVPSAASTTTVTVTGTAQPGASVTVSLGSGLTGTATAAADGTYSVPISGVGTGPYTVSVRQTVAGTPSAAVTRGITVVAASPVVIQAPAVGAQIAVAGPNSTTPVTVSGTAQPDASVAVQLATGVTATVTAGSDGSWTTTFPAVPVGDYTASVTQTVAGATSPAATRAFSVVAGADVVIAAPAAGTVSTVADPTSTRSVTVSGTAQPNASVAVALDATHTATATANGAGAWTTTFTGVGVGDYAITAAQTVNGTTSVPVTRPYSIVAGAPVVITAPAPGATVLVAGAGTSAAVAVSGTAQPNASVSIDLGGLTATVTANASGVWTSTFTTVGIGSHTIRVHETVGGTTSPDVTQTLTVAAGDPIAITAPNPGDSVTVFGADGTTTVVVSGTAQAGSRVTAGFGAGLNATTTASASGAWTVSIPNVPVGDYSLSATQTINGSSASSGSQAFSVIEGDGIVIQAPASGTVFPVADAGSTRPSTTVSGVADVGAAVTVTLDSGQTRSTTASGTGTWSVSFANLTPRTYTVGATQTVGALSSPAIATSFTIAVGDPVTITSPAVGTDYTVAAAGQVLPVTLTGTAQANAVVHVTADGRTVDVTASAAGRWSLVLDGTADGTGSGLGIGDYPVSATQSVGGTTSTLPATTEFTVSAATLFAVGAPIDGSTVPVADDASTITVPVSGTGQVGASVAVTHAGVTKTATVGMNGTWSTSFPGVGTGDQTFVSVETVGSTTAGPISRTITVKAAPAVTVVAPESGSTILVAGSGSTTDVTATGTAAPDAPVTVTVGSTSVDTTATAGGTWTADLGQLGTATYTVAVTQTVNGTTSTPVTSTFQVAAAPAVVITTPAGGTTITVADDDSTTSVPVAGTAAPNATVDVTIGSTTREVTASGTGAWSTIIPNVGTGTATISVTQTIGDTVSVAVTATVVIAAGDPIAITTPSDGSTVTVADAAAKATIPVTGTAQAGASVRVTLDGGSPETVTADDSGNWSTSFTGVAVEADPHTVSATQTVNGTTSAAVTSDVTVAAGERVTITTPEDGDAYVVASASATTDVKVTGTAEAGATVTAELGNGIAATATAKGDGSYTLTLGDVPTGPHTISVTQTVDGTTSAEPATVKITVGTADAVVITTPTAGTDLQVATIGETVDVPVSGIAEPAADITVDLGGGLTATTTAGDDGKWSVTVHDAPVGDHTISVVQTIGGFDSVPVTRDLTVSVADRVTVSAPTSGATIPVATAGSTTTVPVSGTAEPNTAVRVSLDGGTPTVVTSDGGGAWSTTFTGVGVDDHSVSVVEVLDNGPTTPVVVAFSVGVAQALTISTPQAGQQFQLPLGATTTTVPVSGTGLPGASVTATLDGLQPKTTTVAANGTWSVSFPGVGMLPATHEIEAVQTIAGTAQAPKDVTFSVVLSLTPAAPVEIISPAAGDVLPDADGDGTVDVPVSGTGQPGSTVTVDLGNGHTATTTVLPGGTWSVTVTGVPVGPITIVVTQTTNGTVTSSDSATVTADTVTAAAITAPADGSTISVSNEGATTDLTVSGTGEPGASIAIDLGGGLAATATVGSNGRWTATVDGVPVGDHTISVVETSDGAVLPAVTSKVSVDVADPVTIETPADGTTVTQTSAGGSLPVTGTAQAGEQVSVSLDGGTPKIVTAGTDGTWAVTFPAVAAGDHEISVTQELADGPTDAVTADVTVRVANDVAITAPQTGQQIQVQTGSATNVAVSGTGEPGAKVKVVLNGVDPQTVTVTPQGTWSTTFTAVDPGSRNVTATQTVGGVAGDPVKVTFTVVEKTNPVAAPTITSPSAGQIVRDDDGDGFFDVPVTGTGEPGSAITVDLGNGLTRTTTVGTDGTWSVTVTAVPDGQATIQVTQKTGSVTTGSTAVTVTGTKAAPIAITAPTAGQNVPAGLGGTGATTVTGTAEPGATVKVRVDGGTAQTVTADGSGAWSVSLTGLATGSHTVTATETVGVATSAPVTVAFTVIPVASTGGITVLDPSDGALIMDADGDGHEAVPISGIGTPGALVTVDLDNGTILTTTVRPDGSWAVTFPVVPTGDHTFIASQTVAGVSTSAPQQSFTLGAYDPLMVASPIPGSTFVAGRDGFATVDIMGTAEPGAMVTIMLDDGDTQTVTADADGNWDATFEHVSQGTHTYTATQTIDGAVSDPVTTTFTVVPNGSITPGGGGTGGGTGGSGGGTGSGNGAGTGSGTVDPAGNGGTTSSGPASLVERGLAYTGSVVLPWAAVGAGILALGLGMLGASRGLSRIRARRR